MSLPRAPKGFLSDHVKRWFTGSQEKAGDAQVKSEKMTRTIADESESSSSNSGSDSDEIDEGEFMEKLLSQAPGAKKGVKQEPEEEGSLLAAVPAKSQDSVPLIAKNKTKKERNAGSTTDSDSDSNDGPSLKSVPIAKAAKVTPKKKKVAKKADTSSSSEDSDNQEERGAAINGVTARSGDAADSSSESEDDSESEASKSKAADTSSPEESSSDSGNSDSSSSEAEHEEEKGAGTKQAAKSLAKGVSKQSTAAASTTSDSDSGDEEPSKNESSDEAVQESDVEMADGDVAATVNNAVAEMSGRNEVVAPGFRLLRADKDHGASQVAEIFKKAKSDGQQVWVLTAPSSIPITLIEQMEIPVDGASSGQAILSHNGNDYGLNVEPELTSRTIQLYIPKKTGEEYKPLDHKLRQSMHLERITPLSGSGEHAIAESLKPAITGPRPARPQPAGLKQRFLPIGVNGPSTPVSRKGVQSSIAKASTSKEIKAIASSLVAPDITISSKSKKRKADADLAKASERAQSPKKAKKSKAQDVPSSSIPTQVTPIAPPSRAQYTATPIPLPTRPSLVSQASSTKLSRDSSEDVAAPAKKTSPKKASAVPLPTVITAQDTPKPQKSKKKGAEPVKADSPAAEMPAPETKKKKAARPKKDSKAPAATPGRLNAPRKETPVPLPRIGGR